MSLPAGGVPLRHGAGETWETTPRVPRVPVPHSSLAQMAGTPNSWDQDKMRKSGKPILDRHEQVHGAIRIRGVSNHLESMYRCPPTQPVVEIVCRSQSTLWPYSLDQPRVSWMSLITSNVGKFGTGVEEACEASATCQSTYPCDGIPNDDTQ